MSGSEWGGLLLFVVLVLAWMSIFRRAGYSRWLGLLWLVPVANAVIMQMYGFDVTCQLWLFPVVNVMIICFLAFADWPVHRHSRYLKIRSGDASEEDAYNVLGDAFRLERKGQFDAAMERYQEIATRFSDRPPGRDAENYIQTLRTKMGSTAKSDDPARAGEVPSTKGML